MPPLVVRPVHPTWGLDVQRNVAAHRPAFWALALLVLAEDRQTTSASDSIALQRAVHCALSRLRYDIATLPPGAICGDPPKETELVVAAANSSSPVTEPNRFYGLQVDWGRLTSSPLYNFSPSRAHGPKPRTAVAVDATPVIDREHMFTPHDDLKATAAILTSALVSCTSPEVSGSSWFQSTVNETLRDLENAVPHLVGDTGAESQAVQVPSIIEPSQVHIHGRALLGLRAKKELTGFSYSAREGATTVDAKCPLVLDLRGEGELSACKSSCLEDVTCAGSYYSAKERTCIHQRCTIPSNALPQHESATARNVSQIDGKASNAQQPPVWMRLGNDDEAAWDDDCTHLMQIAGMSLESCKSSCFSDSDCTSVNYNAEKRDCIFRQCDDPLTPRLRHDTTYTGYQYWGLQPGQKRVAPSPLPRLRTHRGSLEATCSLWSAILHDIGLPGQKSCPPSAESVESAPRFFVALPTEDQLDGRCLRNCFQSSQRRRDIAISQAYQHYGVRFRRGSAERMPAHLPFLLHQSLPALAEYYGDVFVALNVGVQL